MIELIVGIAFMLGAYNIGFETAICNPESPIIAEHRVKPTQSNIKD